MTTDHDPRTRIVLSWLRQEVHENPERMLLRALDEVDATPQRRSWWPAWRSNRMNPYAKLLVAAAAVLVVAVIGYQFLPRSGGVGGTPTITPLPSPSLLARGNFVAHGISAELDATRVGADVVGSMTMSQSGSDNRATVDLECARTTAEGLIVIGGLITDSTFEVDRAAWHGGLPEGQRAAVILEPGSPVKALWWVTLADDAPVASCGAFFDSINESEDRIVPGTPGLDPIAGTVEFGS